ncbi:MAG: 6-carboxyhexanoate--CoA ligase [Desulfuromonas sp.]|nr:MAG: 6-carboxyhexanoate--CoA ligase [Desulfuromonas sp.]
MSDDLCSIRMHASSHGEHLSGAEQLVGFDELHGQAVALLQRALQHERGHADSVQITIDPISSRELVCGRLPRMTNRRLESVAAARSAAVELLTGAGVTESAAQKAVLELAHGAAPGQRVMRGAMLIESDSGVRLEVDAARGVRVSRLGISAAKRIELQSLLRSTGLEASRVAEALTLASKVQSHPNVVAELCWSDDPSYQTGYVATQTGYTRLTPLKESGDPLGGRAFFVRPGCDLLALIAYLESTPYLVTDLGHLADDLRKIT